MTSQLRRAKVVIDVTRVLFGILVRKNIPPAGFALATDVPKTTYGASVPAWGQVLAETEADLHAKKEEYKVLHIDGAEVTKTHTKTLAFTISMVTNEILAGNKVAVALVNAG